MITKFEYFINEIRKSKMEMFKDPNISNKFTYSIEIELESYRMGDSEDGYTEDQVSDIIKLIKDSLFKELGRSKWFEMNDKNSQFIEDILHEVENDYEDDDYLLDDLLSEKKYRRDKSRLFVVQILKPMIINYFFKENFNYLKDKFRSSFPYFYKKWSQHLKFELDNTLDRGIEISNSTYFIGVEDLINLINDFYTEYETNKKWKFKKTTGIHINIGSRGHVEFNPIKGILFLDDSGDDPFVFKNMIWRKNNKYCGSLKDRIQKETYILSKSLDLLKSGNISECEKMINGKLISLLVEEGYKNFGINLLNINKNYIEFRYPGGNIGREVLIDKLMYFSYIYYMMTNKDLDRKDYTKKLYKFLEK